MKTALEWGERIPLGVIYQNERPTFEDHFPVLKQGPVDWARGGSGEIAEGHGKLS